MRSASLLERGLSEPQCDRSWRNLTLEFHCFFFLSLNLVPLIRARIAQQTPGPQRFINKTTSDPLTLSLSLILFFSLPLLLPLFAHWVDIESLYGIYYPSV